MPWQNIVCEDKDKTKKVGEFKLKCSVYEICKDLPEGFVKYFEHLRKLKFEDKPNYGYLRAIFKDMAKKFKIEIDYVWDWIKP